MGNFPPSALSLLTPIVAVRALRKRAGRVGVFFAYSFFRGVPSRLSRRTPS
jgi:hypothetical protein